jgi:hypothetical protein
MPENKGPLETAKRYLELFGSYPRAGNSLRVTPTPNGKNLRIGTIFQGNEQSMVLRSDEIFLLLNFLKEHGYETP